MKKLFDVKGIPRDTLDICGMKNADGTRMGASGADCCSCCAGGCG